MEPDDWLVVIVIIVCSGGNKLLPDCISQLWPGEAGNLISPSNLPLMWNCEELFKGKESSPLPDLLVTAYLDLLYLVLDDSLLMFDGGLQVFVSLQQGVAQLGGQLQV